MTSLFQRNKKEAVLSSTAASQTRIIFQLAIVTVAVVSVGYILFLAILAPEQLAEATTAATDLVCSGCVGTSDIADSAVTSAKIGSGQVTGSDLATSAVTGGKISDTAGVASADIVNDQVASEDIKDFTITSADIAQGTIPSGTTPADNSVTSAKIVNGEVKNADLASFAVTTSKISDTNGVQSADIVNGQVTSDDIKDATITSTDIAPGVISGAGSLEVVNRLVFVNVPPGDEPSTHNFISKCNTDEVVTGGGYLTDDNAIIVGDAPLSDGWIIHAQNPTSTSFGMNVYAMCAKIVS